MTPAPALTPAIELLERDYELQVLSERVRGAREGRGTTVLIKGTAGVGKTALADAAGRLGEVAGARVLRASGTEFERDLAFGVVRQLFERVVRDLDQHERFAVLDGAAGISASVLTGDEALATRPGSLHAVLHGLYWLAAQLAAERPLVLIVDDAHSADFVSLRWLGYLARRLEGVPLLSVITFRPADLSSHADVFDAMAADDGVAVLEPQPLGEDAVRRWLGAVLTEAARSDIASTCHAVTGGNPFLLSELVVSLRGNGDGTALSSRQVVEAAPASVGASVSTRLTALGADAVAVAEATAILAPEARLNRVAELAGVLLPRAAATADALVQVAILAPGDPLTFRHPMLRTAVYGRIRGARRSLMHAAAAELLHRDGRIEEAASHLLRAPARGRADAVAALRTAASLAVTRGAPEAAVPLLRRALDEGPQDGASVLVDLARAEAMVMDPAAVDHARAALEASPSHAERVQVAVSAGQVLAASGRFDEALDLFARIGGHEGVGASDQRAMLAHTTLIRAWKAGPARCDVALDTAYIDSLAGTRSEERSLLSVASMQLASRGGDAKRATALARRALAHEDLAAPDNEIVPITCARVLTVADAYCEARNALDAINDGARKRGSVIGTCLSCTMRAELQLRLGRLVDAEADAREAVRLARDHEIVTAAGAVGFLAEALLERSSPAAALDVVAEFGYTQAAATSSGEKAVDDLGMAILLHARGRARSALNDLVGAESDFRAAGRRELACGERNPAVLPWRSSLAFVLAATSAGDEADALIDEEIALARKFGAPRAIGIALRSRALLRPRDASLSEIEEAAALLSSTGADLEHARTVVDMGVALRRAGRRAEAGERLRTGLDLASRCGARTLAARARSALIQLGARPRRERLSGVEALTVSERRVVELASAGQTNRQVAQALFVTAKTVEIHLTRAYSKLGITSRKELSAVLSASAADQSCIRPA